MGNEPQTLAGVPPWVLILLTMLGGVDGEMWCADKVDLGGRVLLRHLVLHSGMLIVCGAVMVLLTLACGAALLLAVTLGSLTAAVDAKIAVGLYEH